MTRSNPILIYYISRRDSLAFQKGRMDSITRYFLAFQQRGYPHRTFSLAAITTGAKVLIYVAGILDYLQFEIAFLPLNSLYSGITV